MFGNSTPCVEKCSKILNEKGFATVIFHATGSGGKAMEDALCDQDSLNLWPQLLVSFFCQGQIVFFPCHHAVTLISQYIIIILSADAYNRIGGQIPLFDLMKRVIRKIQRS